MTEIIISITREEEMRKYESTGSGQGGAPHDGRQQQMDERASGAGNLNGGGMARGVDCGSGDTDGTGTSDKWDYFGWTGSKEDHLTVADIINGLEDVCLDCLGGTPKE